MVDTDIKYLDDDGTIKDTENNFCVRFHLKSDGHITIPCFYVAGFPIDDEPELLRRQLELTQKYLDAYPDDAYIELGSTTLYNMDVYH